MVSPEEVWEGAVDLTVCDLLGREIDCSIADKSIQGLATLNGLNILSELTDRVE